MSLGTDNAYNLTPDGHFVNSQVQRVVAAIKDYEPRLDVEWIPPGQRTEDPNNPLPAFKIVYRETSESPPYILFHVKDESEFDMRVLSKIIYNDQRATGQQQYSELEAVEMAAAAVKKQEWLDKMEEANDVALHVFKTNLNTYRVNDHLIVKEGIPFNALNY